LTALALRGYVKESSEPFHALAQVREAPLQIFNVHAHPVI
jgi:hypothetical protein